MHQHDPDTRITLGIGFRPPDADATTWLGSSVIRELSFGYGWDSAIERPADTLMGIDLDGISTEFLVNGDGIVAADQPDDPQWLDFLTSLAIALEVLSRIAYLGPIRARPERSASLSTTAYHYVGPEGEYTTEVLAGDPGLVDEVNESFDRLGLGYQIRIVTPTSDEVSVTAGDFAVLGLIDVRDDPHPAARITMSGTAARQCHRSPSSLTENPTPSLDTHCVVEFKCRYRVDLEIPTVSHSSLTESDQLFKIAMSVCQKRSLSTLSAVFSDECYRGPSGSN